MMSYDYPHPVSRTYQYKKITKPLLERKRRARINRCLDELKDLMVDALQTEGENISKLEKADILELTVRHLQKLQASRSAGLSATIASGDEISAESRWQSGFGHCAAEACRFLSSLPGEAAERLARHLAAGLQSRQTNSSPKANLLSPTLVNLDRIANIVAPCPVATSGEIDSAIPSASVSPEIKSVVRADKTVDEIGDASASTTTVSSSTPRCRATMSLVDGDEKLTVNCSDKPKSLRDRRSAATATTTTMMRNKTNDPQDINADDDEEIDVERVDERDPMWRPW
ncbi:enhancer of split mgamma protein-like [Formica exsecta]|uniref:enhancer of split mgamma protein-like n=1 Tax=Formica exsecta TaxID=72781 RepID=UPI00114211DB|nr:enhancer of split mgamma protein-like [Formica exsecta]XP_029677377.1 enhancer of split mgamma protein-like [Formica exsecta]